ncbi:hypothetical protein CC1G_12790 [Coprinopsis cinerea okayama7|uniref:CxC2-like cysteine cluster KDZ transposase-associated domain-containing protein n=1 Tax=Coprinopsis cinerea (strain Okayama-7 / 130 / ATCC MYA-4618 / FGSC 9003) TaxID=240176 RepID=A8P3F6_COPC7|nr:hypothetical protein CC1G_12790 [Coprinopsis cinerea okayama7\|eukprot:XP_001838539.2 hypothetical protein CC1G_12790 [Coprinopsis cinerea okayama7\
MTRKRKSRVVDSFDHEEHPTWIPRQEQRQRVEEHLAYETTISGGAVESQSFYTVPVSPGKQRAPGSAVTFDDILELADLADFFRTTADADEEYVDVASSGRHKKTRTFASDHPFLGFIDQDRYNQFLRMIHVWRHVRQLKRAGRGHDTSGSWGSRPGSCAVLCPACPYPGINLPMDWENTAPDKRYVHSLFLALDANFRLKRKDVSSDENDPGLNHRYAYVVDERQFKTFLSQHGSLIEDDKSTCNNHDAIKSASIRGGRGTAASGVGTAQCSRHDMSRPLGVGDLQKGERYVNMDYFFICTLLFNTPPWVVVSYDIACQWSKNLRARLQVYPDYLTSAVSNVDFVFLIPKFHLPAHVAKCRSSFSFNFTRGAGRTDGEAPERTWAAINKLASSFKEMGPGSRRDGMDDHYGDRNWTKVVAMATTLWDRAQEALIKRTEKVEAFRDFSSALETSTKDWGAMVRAWEADNSKPNPYESSSTHMTASAVRLELAEEDESARKEGRLVSAHAEVTPSVFIMQGIELEEAQRRLRYEFNALGDHSTDLQRAKVTQRSTSVQRRIDAWMTLQNIFMPMVAGQRESETGPADTTFDIPLHLPSSVCSTMLLEARLLECEQRLRVAQAETALHDIRVLLLMRTQLWKSRKRHVSGTRQLTQSSALLAKIKEKLDRLTDKYRYCRTALVNLAVVTKDLSWEGSLKPLCAVGDSVDAHIKSELRLEWCKTRARAHRWQEECMLLAEEMRRVLAFWNHEIDTWDRLASTLQVDPSVVTPDPSVTQNLDLEEIWRAEVDKLTKIRDGKVAFALRQAAIRREMVRAAEKKWGNVRDLLTVFEGRSGFELVEVDLDTTNAPSAGA